MPGEMPSSSPSPVGEMPGAEMPRGEMDRPVPPTMATGEMPRGEMRGTDSGALGTMPGAPDSGGGDPGPGGMPLGLMTGTAQVVAAAGRSSAGIVLPGVWRLVLQPVSPDQE